MEFDELRHTPIVTIYKKGIVAFNTYFKEIFHSQSGFNRTCIQILYIKDKNIIAFREFKSIGGKLPKHLYTPCTYPYQFTPKAFFDFYQLNISGIKGKYLPGQIDSKLGELWGIDLNKKLRIIGDN